MKIEELPTVTEASLIPGNPVKDFIHKHTPPDPFIDSFRYDLTNAIAYAEKQLTDKILSRLIDVAKQYQRADFGHSFSCTKYIISEIEQLTSTEPMFKNGHLCGVFCEICKPHIED